MYLNDAIQVLRDAGIENAREDAISLFCHFGGYSRALLFAENRFCQSRDLKDAVLRRAKREPLQYIIGSVLFRNEEYKVTKDTLIPRPDTERLVEIALSILPKGAHFADFCTGSGCVAISTLAARADLTAVGFDISDAALAVAGENAVRNGVDSRIAFCRADLLERRQDAHFDAILCNPPYIAEKERRMLAPELSFEPQNALFAEEDGLLFYRRLLELYAADIKRGMPFLFEIGCAQGDALATLAVKHGLSFEIFKDYGQNDRVVLIK